MKAYRAKRNGYATWTHCLSCRVEVIRLARANMWERCHNLQAQIAERFLCGCHCRRTRQLISINYVRIRVKTPMPSDVGPFQRRNDPIHILSPLCTVSRIKPLYSATKLQCAGTSHGHEEAPPVAPRRKTLLACRNSSQAFRHSDGRGNLGWKRAERRSEAGAQPATRMAACNAWTGSWEYNVKEIEARITNASGDGGMA
eukprot:scaffold305676_cov37-Tisochrysis_lutea.AAC.3